MEVDFKNFVSLCATKCLDDLNHTIGDFNNTLIKMYKDKFLCRENLSKGIYTYYGKIIDVKINFDPFNKTAVLNDDLRMCFSVSIKTTKGKIKDSFGFLSRKSVIFDDEESALLFCEVSE